MPDSIILNKVASVERCVERILEDYFELLLKNT